MTSKERVLAAVNHKTADRTPITFDAESEVYDLLYKRLGLSEKSALFDKLNVDTWMILPDNYEYVREECDKPERTSIWGYRKRVTEYSGGTYMEICHNP